MKSFTLKRNDRVVGMGTHEETKSLTGGDIVFEAEPPKDFGGEFNIPHTCVSMFPYDPDCPKLFVPTADLTEHDQPA